MKWTRLVAGAALAAWAGAPAIGGAATVPAIDTSNAGAVVAAYNAYYNVAMPAVGFTGSSGTCNAGAISATFQDWTMTRINFLRAMAGVPGNTTLDASLNAQQQAGALIEANNPLSHAPPNTDTCYSLAGSASAGQSNIAQGGILDFLPLWMDDPGLSNVGHRRWILHSAKSSFGFGEVTDGLYGAGAVLSVFQSGGSASVPSGIPWPPRGYVPVALFPDQYSTTQLWSFGLPNASFGSAIVQVTLNGVPLTVTRQADAPGYGDNTLVWQMPAGHTTVAGNTYQVTISNVGGVSPTTYTYPVIAFDPANSAADVALTQSASASPVGTGKDVVFTMTATNNGPGTATGVTVNAAYDATATVIWASPACVKQNGVAIYVCTAGTLANGGSTSFKLVLRKGVAGSTFNNAAVSSATSDPNAANNQPTNAVSIVASPAGAPILRYRLYSPVTLEHHFTTDLNEYNTLGTFVGVWTQEGTVGHVLNNPGSFNGVIATPYYRLYDTVSRRHHWTTDANEYYTLLLYPNWSGEGVDGYILPSPAAGAIQLYRLNYPYVAGLHHWTIDSNEYTTLISTYGWIGEGGSGFVIQ